MERVLVLVEGQTEEKFVHRVLQPHLWTFGVHVDCTLVVTAKEHGRRAYRGGVTRYERIRGDIRLLLRSRSRAVTTLFDVYAFPTDLPGFPAPWPAATKDRADRLAEAIERDIADPRFFAGLCVHEFEGLLFTAPEILAEVVEPEVDRRAELSAKLAAIRGAFATPEDIDDGRDTAPSRRLGRLVTTYDKPLHGANAAERIGLPAIRAACPLFGRWLARLESLGQPPST